MSYNNTTLPTSTQCYRIPAQTDMKLRFLSIGLKMSMGRILESLVDELWEREGDSVSALVTSQKASKKVQKVLKRARIK